MAPCGYDNDFVPELLDDFICVVCHLALKQPIQIEACGHRFCESCFEDMKNHVTDGDEMQCPIDRQLFSYKKVFKDKGTERIILNWKVKCPNHQKGCDWIGELNTVENHTKDCSFREKEPNGIQEKILERFTQMEKTISTEINDVKNQFDDLRKDMKTQIDELRKDFSSEIKQIKDSMNQLKNNFWSINQKPSVTGPDDLRTLSVVSDSKWEWKCPVFNGIGMDCCSPIFYHHKWCFQLWMACGEDGCNETKLGFFLSRIRGIFDHPDNYLEDNIPKEYTFMLSMKRSHDDKNCSIDLCDTSWTIEKGEKESEGSGLFFKNGFNYIIHGFYHITCQIIKKESSNEPSRKRSKK